MPSFCTSCDIHGSEKLVPGTFTLGNCKQACRDDSGCYGIDYGFDNKKCYLTTVPIADGAFDSSSSYDGYRKTSCSSNKFSILALRFRSCFSFSVNTVVRNTPFNNKSLKSIQQCTIVSNEPKTTSALSKILVNNVIPKRKRRSYKRRSKMFLRNRSGFNAILAGRTGVIRKKCFFPASMEKSSYYEKPKI